VEQPEGNKPLVRPEHRCMNNIEVDLREMEWGGMDRSDLAQDRN
jgi:hypothetical protein